MEDKFLEYFNKYKDDIYRLAYSYLGSYSDTDDVVQVVFMKLFKNINKLNDNVKGWLIKVTINECKTYFLSSWYKKITLFSDEIDIKDKENENDLLDEIMKLDKKKRVIIYLYYYQDFKIKEIAKLLKMKENTVKTNLVRARRELREFLKEENDEEES